MFAATSNTIAVWAAAGAIAAVMVSIVSAYFAWRSARAADRAAESNERLAAIEADRRADEIERSEAVRAEADRQAKYDLDHAIQLFYDEPYIRVKNTLKQLVHVDEMWFEPDFVDNNHPEVRPTEHNGGIQNVPEAGSHDLASDDGRSRTDRVR